VAAAPAVSLWPPHLLTAGDLTGAALTDLLALARVMKADPVSRVANLAGRAVACFYDPPTTGETVAIGLAATRLGMLPVVLPRAELELGSGEPLGDIARTYSALAVALVAEAIAHSGL
jgi:ornithine carbamoyltransferase